MKRFPLSIAPKPSSSSIHPGNDSIMPDLLWISKQQQQHPSTYLHPLKNTVRVSSNGGRHKFDGKQWRTLCESSDGFECRNLAFRSSLCQKHFYKLHLLKRPIEETGSVSTLIPGIPPFALKRPKSHPYAPHHHHHQNTRHDLENKHEEIYEEDDNSIEILSNNDCKIIERGNHNNKDFRIESGPKFTFFSIDCDSQSELHVHDLHQSKVQSSSKLKRFDSTNNDSVISNESENLSLNISTPKIIESIRLGLPPLTRTEEKSLANELMIKLPMHATISLAEHIARHRVCEIIMDNYSHQLLPINITSEWFYDFLLRNPRLPIHFQTWFSSIKPTIPSSDQVIDIKIWELGLVTRSITPSSSTSSGSSSP